VGAVAHPLEAAMATMAAMAAMSAIQLLFERRMLSTGACLLEPYDSEMYELLGERFEICAVQFSSG